VENIFQYLMYVKMPEKERFDPINNFLSLFSGYLAQESPRKTAYWDILPKVLLEMPTWGLGVTSMLNRNTFFTDLIFLNEALIYVFADAGYVRLLLEYGIMGSIIWGVLLFGIYMHAKKTYINLNNPYSKMVSLAVMAGIITLIPSSFGTALILSKSYGLYLWMYIGMSQSCEQKNIVVPKNILVK